MCAVWMWHLWLRELQELERQTGKLENGEGAEAHANKLMKILRLQCMHLWGKSITVNKYNWRPERFIIWQVSGSLLSPLGVLAWPLVAVEFWLGVVSTFLWRAFFLLDTGVRGGGSANRSTSLLCALTFSLFSVVLSLSLLSWQCCGVIRPLSEVGLEAHFRSTDGDTSFFRKENADECDS